MFNYDKLPSGFDDSDVKLTEIQKLRFSQKSNDGKLYLDIRKWLKYPNLDQFVPSKKGIMLEFEAWRKILPLIHSIVDDK